MLLFVLCVAVLVWPLKLFHCSLKTVCLLLQDLLTVQVNIQILPCATFLESSIKGLLSTVIVTCLLLYYSVLFNITKNQSLAVGNSVPFYFAANALLLTIPALPYRFGNCNNVVALKILLGTWKMLKI